MAPDPRFETCLPASARIGEPGFAAREIVFDHEKKTHTGQHHPRDVTVANVINTMHSVSMRYTKPSQNAVYPAEFIDARQ